VLERAFLLICRSANAVNNESEVKMLATARGCEAMFVKSKVSKAARYGLILAGAMFAGSLSANEKPLQLAQLTEGFDAERTYMQSCAACHNSGAAGAPRVGNAADWAPRAEKGFDVLVLNTINGLGGVMPAKGLCFTCSDEDLKALVQYMLDKSKPE
jgi:cytochrome c5